MKPEASADPTVIVDRRNVNVVRTIVAGVVAPLIIATVIGYISLHTTAAKLTLVMEQSERRITMIEQEAGAAAHARREMQILMTEQSAVLKHAIEELRALRMDQNKLREQQYEMRK